MTRANLLSAFFVLALSSCLMSDEELDDSSFELKSVRAATAKYHYLEKLRDEDNSHDSVAEPTPDESPLSGQALRDFALTYTGSLKNAKRPNPRRLRRFVRNRRALLVLGKALFWDQQLGSDGQACASCHFHAGADNRSRNAVNPGFRITTPGIDTNAFNDETGFGPNLNAFGPDYQLTAADFPLRRLTDPTDADSEVVSDTNDIVSSQGAFNALFTGVAHPIDQGIPSAETGFGKVFNVEGALVRTVSPRNAATVINSALNHRNFWNGLARSEFNGGTPTGKLVNVDIVRMACPGPRSRRALEPQLINVLIPDSSVASQAVVPILAAREMSFAGRRRPDVGRRLLDQSVVPLGMQIVHPKDSVLGPLSLAPDTGLDATYADLIRKAFDRTLWDISGWVVDVSEDQPRLVRADAPVGPDQYSIMEYNFSLFLGLAVQAYLETLISDDTPFDRFMEGDLDALDAQEQLGLDIFLGSGKCVSCHGGPELTNASLNNLRNGILARMITGDNRVAVYDNGFFNIGVRPTDEDLGVAIRVGPQALAVSDTVRYQEHVADRVDELLVSHPELDLDDAIRQANENLDVPRIRAMPEDGARLLAVSGPLAQRLLEDVATGLRTLVEALPAGANCSTGLELLEAADALLVEADVRLASGDSTTVAQAGPALSTAAERLGQVAELVGSPAFALNSVAQAREHIAPALSLLPDPIDPGPDPLHPFAPPLRPDERLAVEGALKTPGLRNVELTAPFLHNGGLATLEQVVEFFNRGGDFAHENVQNLGPNIQPLGLSAERRAALVAFLRALTDERVRFERAPFDHPSISIPNGGGELGLLFGVPISERRVTIPAVGRKGSDVPLGTPNTTSANFLQSLTPSSSGH